MILGQKDRIPDTNDPRSWKAPCPGARETPRAPHRHHRHRGTSCQRHRPGRPARQVPARPRPGPGPGPARHGTARHRLTSGSRVMRATGWKAVSLPAREMYARAWVVGAQNTVRLTVDGHQDLPSDGHEVGAMAITQSARIRRSPRRRSAPNAGPRHIGIKLTWRIRAVTGGRILHVTETGHRSGSRYGRGVNATTGRLRASSKSA